MSKTFNPLEWMEIPNQQQQNTEQNYQLDTDNNSEVEKVIKNIEAKQIDIAPNYNDWISIGFAFADEFGESGRSLFHRVSQYYSGYNIKECNKQFDNCLKSKGQGVSLKTFFFLAKQAGVSIITQSSDQYNVNSRNFKSSKVPGVQDNQEEESITELMPTFPKSLYFDIPEYLQQVVEVATSDEERDILLLGSLAAISACFPKIYGIYDGKKVFSNLFLFVTAQASAGKGRLVHCRQLVNPIHKELREEAKLHKQHFEIEMAEYNANKGKVEGIEKPARPPEKMLFVPANNSSTGAYQLLGDSDGKGLIFETEGDTLAHAFKSDYGNYSDGFRKAFHHETISYYRRTDREFVDIESPCLSTVLSGTPKQVSALIPSAENGLFSRFIFYYMNVKPVWKNVFASTTENGLDDYFENLGNQFYELYKLLKVNGDFQFHLTADQQEQFNQFFSEIQVKYLNLQGMDYMATIRRLGLIAFRFCMLFSALRILEMPHIQFNKNGVAFDRSTGEIYNLGHQTGDTSNKLICEERDFQASLAMIKVLVKHSSKVFGELPQEETKPTRKNRKEKFLYALPRNFNRQKYLEVAKKLNIPAKTAEGYITSFIKANLIHREQKDTYINLAIEEVEEMEDSKEV
ncbi:DUF3987 domain-containing protein [Oceanihabitans sediminis]|uniref:DUF3987 domain-containing protein n=1 Tax=Oceanihabitans sediminis TaxID=1812012 RepID=UPI003A94B501